MQKNLTHLSAIAPIFRGGGWKATKSTKPTKKRDMG